MIDRFICANLILVRFVIEAILVARKIEHDRDLYIPGSNEQS